MGIFNLSTEQAMQRQEALRSEFQTGSCLQNFEIFNILKFTRRTLNFTSDIIAIINDYLISNNYTISLIIQYQYLFNINHYTSL